MSIQYDFSPVHQSLQSYIDKELINGAASIILKDNQVVDRINLGFADKENDILIQNDTIYRIYSNTKIVTSVAAMMCHEKGMFQLDDPIENYLPQMRNRVALKTGAQSVNETESVISPPTVRQLFCHNAGFSYGFLLESPLDQLYNEQGILDPGASLSEMVDKLESLPLAYQPGARWQYSVSTDILARLVEVWSGVPFDSFLQAHIFDPLGMSDTGFHVPSDKHDRLAVNYVAADPLDPMVPGLTRQPDQLLGSFLEPKAFHSGGGGLVSTIDDYLAFIQMLIAEGSHHGKQVLKPETVDRMRQNQLPTGVAVQLPTWIMPDTSFGLGLAIKTAPAPGEPDIAAGEVHWGGIAGTHSWIAPDAGIAALVFTQRMIGFWHPFMHDYKRLVYAAFS